jgi:hypothetical protein
MSDPIAFTPALQPAEPPPTDQAPPTNGHVVRTDPAAPGSTPQLQPTPEAQPVPIPSDDGLEADAESGDLYRPFELGTYRVRCAARVPAEHMLDVIATQQRLSEKDPKDMTTAEKVESIQLIGQMLRAVVWDEDNDIVRTALTNKRHPIALEDLSAAVSRLWQSYNTSAGVGKEQPDS